MARVVPFETKYDHIRKLEKASFIVLLTSAVLIFLNWILAKFFGKVLCHKIDLVKEIAAVISYASMVIYLLLNTFARILFHLAEKYKQNDLIDNSFGTNYSDQNTEEYYNNSELEDGIKKLTFNSYESSFHTENTLKYMLYKNLISLLILTIPFLLSIFSKNGSEIVRLLLEISIPLTLLTQFVILFIYYQNIVEINERFKIELINIRGREITQEDIPKLLIPIMQYYSTKAWANTNLDSEIFKKHNTKVSENWGLRKKNLM